MFYYLNQLKIIFNFLFRLIFYFLGKLIALKYTEISILKSTLNSDNLTKCVLQY